MNLLLDTHTVLWLVSEPAKLPQKVSEAIESTENHCLISIASLWEMTIKSSKGSLELPGRDIGFVIQALHDYSYEILPIDVDDMEYLQRLPHFHKDPFDRIILAQTLRHGLTLVTVDGALKDYGVKILWA